MQKRLSKKGISPLIATVLLIGATVGVFLIVFGLIKGVAVSSIEKSTSCGAEEATSLDISGSFTCADNVAKVTVTNNGQVKVEGFMFVFFKGDKGQGAPPTLNPTKPGEQSINELAVDECPDRIEIYPGVVKETSGKAKFVVCKDKKIEVSSV